MVQGTLYEHRTPLAVGDGHERALVPLLVFLLARTVGGALAGVLFPLCLAFEAVEDRFDCFLARGVAGGDVKKLLGGSWALMSQLMNQGLAGGPGQENSYSVGVGDIR